MRLYSWNVNGLRAAVSKGLPGWLASLQPDVLCLQETRCGPDDLPEELRRIAGYHSTWAPATRQGYSGVVTFSRLPPVAWRAGLGIARFDAEGRVLATDLGGLELYNVYCPNGRRGPDRLAYKLAFYAAFLEHVDARAAAGRAVVFGGDVNTAHRPMDLARPSENARSSGFLPEERAWLDRWREHGWVDTFRLCHPEVRGAYTWWDQRTGPRARNAGWRLDYIFVHEHLVRRVGAAGIAPEVPGSDHCPVWLELAD
jgi:exodeoxyribonuclease-3